MMLVSDLKVTVTQALVATQAQSAKLIGEAVQQNPAFLMLRRIEVSLPPL